MPGTQADGKDQSKVEAKKFEHLRVQRMEIKPLFENEGLFIKKTSFGFWVNLPPLQTQEMINAVSMIFCLGSSKHLTFSHFASIGSQSSGI